MVPGSQTYIESTLAAAIARLERATDTIRRGGSAERVQVQVEQAKLAVESALSLLADDPEADIYELMSSRAAR